MAPHLDTAAAVERAYAAEQSAAARDREENARRIREQLADGSSGIGGTVKSVPCEICGSPYGTRAAERHACVDCQRTAKQDPPGLRDKMSPEELYPDHFPDSSDN